MKDFRIECGVLRPSTPDAIGLDVQGEAKNINLRIDYIRPGKGQHFTATSNILRVGSKIAVSRMELRNEEDVLIAVGTGTYTAG